MTSALKARSVDSLIRATGGVAAALVAEVISFSDMLLLSQWMEALGSPASP